MADSKFNVVGIFGIIGAILMVVGVFLTWTTGTVDVIGSYSVEYSGWELATIEPDNIVVEKVLEEFSYLFVPLAMLGLGAVALILNFIPMFKAGNFGKAFTVITLLLSVVAIILAVLFYNDVSAVFEIESLKLGELSVAMGFWLSLAGSLLVALGSVFAIAKKN